MNSQIEPFDPTPTGAQAATVAVAIAARNLRQAMSHVEHAPDVQQEIFATHCQVTKLLNRLREP